jgi:hypothetical protein
LASLVPVLAAAVIGDQAFCCSFSMLSNIDAKIWTGVNASSIPDVRPGTVSDEVGVTHRVAACCG